MTMDSCSPLANNRSLRHACGSFASRRTGNTGAYGLICVQGNGKINGQPLNSPKLIRFTELTEDEYFCTEDGAKAGVTFENTSETEPLVTLRYFGPDVNPDAPAMGAHRKNRFN